MKERFSIYIDKPSIYIIAENHFRNFEFIFKNRAIVYIDASEYEIENFETITGNTVTNDLAFYFNEIDVLPHSGKKAFERFSCQDSSISDEFNGSIFILDISKERAKALSDASGIWIISKEEIEKDPDVECVILDRIKMDKEDVIPGEQYGSSSENGWLYLFGERKKLFPPYNEIIIYDNFLKEYANEYTKVPPYSTKKIGGREWNYVFIGLENLLLLFDAILPQTHNNPLKVLIVLPKNIEVNHENKLENRITIWIEEVKKLRNYTISVSFLLIGNTKTKWKENTKESHPLHPRVLYTNYFYIETEKGFKVFEPYPFSNIIRKDGDSKNSISIESFFSSPRMLSNPIKANFNNKFKDIGEELRNVSLEDISLQNNTLIGDVVSLESFSLLEGINLEL